jgi:hypothetical protein
MRFRADIKATGKTATGIEVPPEVVEALAGGKRPRVTVTLSGCTYRSSVAPMGGVFMLPVSADVRARSGVAAGDVVDVEIELDTQPREIEVPPDLAAALAGAPDAARFFESLSYSRKQRVVLPIGAAKTDETRRRRVDKTIATLREGRI